MARPRKREAPVLPRRRRGESEPGSLTPRQQQLLELIASYQDQEQLPLLRELARRLGLAGESSVRVILRYLEAAGLVRRHPLGRGLPSVPRLTELGLARVRAPVAATAVAGRREPGVWGTVPAGPWREVTGDESELRSSTLADLLPWHPEDGLLQVTGDSLQGDGILSGDWVLVKPGARPARHAIVVAQVREDDGRTFSTLKHWHPAPHGKVHLRSSNPEYEDLVKRADQVQVLGVLTGVIRRLENGR